MIHGDLSYDGIDLGIEARDLEHMAEILTDTLPNADPNRSFRVDIDDGRLLVAFYCSGTYHEVL